MECRQITPVFPHNYKESSYPVGVFVWKITNTGKTNAHVSVMFSFQNGTGGPTDLKGGHMNKYVLISQSLALIDSNRK